MNELLVKKVISGGQTGVDQWALFAAKNAGFLTGGTAAKGWETESGPAPWLDNLGLCECETPGYPARTRKNIEDSCGTLLVGDHESRGSKLAISICRETGRPIFLATTKTSLEVIAEWATANRIVILNIAGNRVSKIPGDQWLMTRVFLERVMEHLARGL